MQIPRRILVLILLLTSSFASLAQRINAKHAQLELVSQQSAAVPDGRLWLGVHFILEKGWHIYWVNPGDSGQPPVFQWQLPPGFVAGALQWPRPEKMQHSQMADYGYHDETLLLLPVQTPRQAPKTQRINIGAEAKWLICREVCIPDHAHLQLSVPVAASADDDPKVAPLFIRTKQLLPKPLPTAWRAKAESRGTEIVLTLTTGKSIASAEFFPLEENQIESGAAQAVSAKPMGMQITLQKSDQLLHPISRLKGVLVVSGKAYGVDAPVTGQ
ncbi:MAG TPA: protein-disulfide reductase DsbD domain-containing protein [Candidatus Angelobacter sp.]|nr:protein-disulfide reductase DsbD domain-containing protein [Candidatus Angelobacter sp.]